MAAHDAMKAIIDRFNVKPELKEEGKSWKGLKFQFKSSDTAAFYIQFGEDGTISLSDGETTDAKDVFLATDQVLDDILNGKLDGVKAFLFGKLKVSGDLASAQKLVALLKKAG
jgi:putative sterol carrier protein